MSYRRLHASKVSAQHTRVLEHVEDVVSEDIEPISYLLAAVRTCAAVSTDESALSTARTALDVGLATGRLELVWAERRESGLVDTGRLNRPEIDACFTETAPWQTRGAKVVALSLGPRSIFNG